MSDSVRCAAWLCLLMAAAPAQAGETTRLDLSQFLAPDVTAIPLRPMSGPTGLGKGPAHVGLPSEEAATFEPNFERLRGVWMRARPSPPLVFREPFPRRRSVQDRRGEGVALVFRSTAP